MAVIEGVYLGMNAKLYVEGKEFKNVKDVTLNFSRATADVTTRRNDGWRANVGTLREATASFQMIKFKGDTDAKTILDNFLDASGDLIGAAFLDASVDEGGEGIVGEWSVTSCNRGEALEDAITYDVELSLTQSYGWAENGALTYAGEDTGGAIQTRINTILPAKSGSGSGT